MTLKDSHDMVEVKMIIFCWILLYTYQNLKLATLTLVTNEIQISLFNAIPTMIEPFQGGFEEPRNNFLERVLQTVSQAWYMKS